MTYKGIGRYDRLWDRGKVGKELRRDKDLENSFRKHSIVFLGDLRLICRSVKNGRVVVDILLGHP